MRDFIDDLLAPDDTATEASPYEGGATVGIVVGERAKSPAELEAIEKEIFTAPMHRTEFREPGCMTIAEYEHARALGLLLPEDEILVLADLLTRIA